MKPQQSQNIKLHNDKGLKSISSYFRMVQTRMKMQTVPIQTLMSVNLNSKFG